MAIERTSAAGAVEIVPDLNAETERQEENNQRIIESAKQSLGQGYCRRGPEKERRSFQIFPQHARGSINVKAVQLLSNSPAIPAGVLSRGEPSSSFRTLLGFSLEKEPPLESWRELLLHILRNLNF